MTTWTVMLLATASLCVRVRDIAICGGRRTYV